MKFTLTHVFVFVGLVAAWLGGARIAWEMLAGVGDMPTALKYFLSGVIPPMTALLICLAAIILIQATSDITNWINNWRNR